MTNITVKKRDGRIQDFNRQKIIDALSAAFLDANGCITKHNITQINHIADYIEKELLEHPNRVYSIEEISDMSENGLMNLKDKRVARAYIRYRQNRERARAWNNRLMDAMSDKLGAVNVQNSNANLDENSFGGRKNEADAVVLKQYALDNCMSEMARNNHLHNEIYIHDLDSYALGMHNCLTMPIDDLLANGFNTRQTDVRPANSINTAMQLVAVLFQLQSLAQFGGVSASHLDWSMVPYVRKSFYKHFLDGLKYVEDISGTKYIEWRDSDDIEHLSIEAEAYKIYPKAYAYASDMTEKELRQAVEGMYHNLNTLQSRSGNQLPFTSINYGTCTLHEGRIVIKALLEGSIKGVGKLHRTSIFPCGIFQCMTGVNRKPGDPNYDMFKLAIKSTAKRLYPNYCNVDWSINAGYDRNDPKTYVSTMGCRTYNGSDINGLGQLKDGRGNICPVTIIMPTLAMMATERAKEALSGINDPTANNSLQEEITVSAFLQILDKKIGEAKDMLLERFDWICKQSADSAKFMYTNQTMAGYKPKEGIKSALKHGTLAIGNIGLAETLQILVGCDHTLAKGMEVAKKIYSLFAK